MDVKRAKDVYIPVDTPFVQPCKFTNAVYSHSLEVKYPIYPQNIYKFSKYEWNVAA